MRGTNKCYMLYISRMSEPERGGAKMPRLLSPLLAMFTRYRPSRDLGGGWSQATVCYCMVGR
jgi:hypothetical protein